MTVEPAELRDLVVRSNKALLGLLVVSEGKVQNLSSEVIHGGDPDFTPRGPRALHDYHRGRIQRARGVEALRAAVCAAEEALSIARGGEARHRATRRWELFVVERYEGWTTADVADAERCKRMEVWRAREKHRRNGRDGSPRQAAVAA